MISKEQLERVTGFVQRAEEAGGKVLTGGKAIDQEGFWYTPTVVTEVDQQAEIIQKEVFGPVVTVQRFSDEAEGIRWANGVPYGLAASVCLQAQRASGGVDLVRLEYDRDSATVYGFLKHYGLEKEIKVNIEANHATLAGNSFEHEIANAVAFGIFGNRFILEHLLQTLVRVATDIAHRRSVVLRDLMDLLSQLFPALFRERWNRNANKFAVVRRIKPKIGSPYRLFNCAYL